MENRRRFRVDFDSRLIERAVMAAIADHPLRRDYERAREHLYEIADADLREHQFDLFHHRWFLDLKLDSVVAQVLCERPRISQNTQLCRVLPAVRARNEGADLVGGVSGRVVVILLRAESLVKGSVLLPFLRHELTHIDDMLDTAFGYRREGWSPSSGQMIDNLIRERYRVLWDTWIDGRLEARGWAEEGVRQRRWEEFAGTFPMLREECEDTFREWFEGEFHTHQEMVDFANQPRGVSQRGHRRQGRCPLCRFPSFDLLEGNCLAAPVLAEIEAAFPQWQPSLGLCRQCFDLYQSRKLSRQFARSVPGNQRVFGD